MAENPCRRHQGSFSLHWEVAASLECPLELDNDTSEHLMAHQGFKGNSGARAALGKAGRDQILIGLTQTKNPRVRVRPGHDG